MRRAGHVRRKFNEAAKAASNKDSQAHTTLDFIGQLYGVERQIKHRREQCSELLDDAAVLALRHTYSAPVLDQFKPWLDTHADSVLPQSCLGKAIHYTLK